MKMKSSTDHDCLKALKQAIIDEEQNLENTR